jgi:hypothetical protein
MRFPNFLTALSAVRRAILALFRRKSLLVPDVVLAARLEACRRCPEFNSTFGQCNVCTCFVALKANLTTEDCPRGRWSRTLTQRLFSKLSR